MNKNDELRYIQAELKKPFPAPLHEIRELPGGTKKWVFLRWQTVRERLDEVAPDWTIDHSEIQYLGNDAICRCGITIMGIRKEAIASVPLVVLSKNGNDMSRGCPADRLAAEALKNAAETWGVGRYLDDQIFTIVYLWKNSRQLSAKFTEEVRQLTEQSKLQFKKNGGTDREWNDLIGTANNHAETSKASSDGTFIEPEKPNLNLMPNTSDQNKCVSEAQGKRLWAIARSELKLDEPTIKAAQKHFGFEHTKDITQDKYEPLIECLRLLPAQPWHIWKNPEDAILWAQLQLPEHGRVFLEQEFSSIEATNGKKAPAWVKRVQKLREEF